MSEKFLQLDERNRLAGTLAGLYDFTDLGATGIRVFLEGAGLKRFVSGMNLSLPPRVVAADLIGRVEPFGDLPERPNYHALGALLDAVLNVGELPQDQARFVASLIVRYSLVYDPDYIRSTRQRYDITGEPAREPETSHAPPPLAPGQTPEGPEFSAAIPDEAALERVINSEDNFLDLYMLYGALYSSLAICRIERPQGRALGTGFLVNKDILMTNQHVLRDQDYLEDAVARFNYRVDASGVAGEGRLLRFDPDFYHASPSADLDFALVRLTEKPLEGMSSGDDISDLSKEQLVLRGKHAGYLTLAPREIKEHERVNVIQHPDGDPLKVVLTQNYVVADMTGTRVHYIADTKPGSSGSPVFNERWDVVAIHHSGGPYPPESIREAAKKAWKGHFRFNEGVPMRAILKAFSDRGLDRFLPR
jgi:V8-like Glu-specific endopeptidase